MSLNAKEDPGDGPHTRVCEMHSVIRYVAPEVLLLTSQQPLGPPPPPPPPAYPCGPGFGDKFPLDEADPRNSSIAALRLKAKEHIQAIGKPWQAL